MSDFSPDTISLSVSGQAYFHAFQAVGNVEEALYLGDIAAYDFTILKNIDSRNFVNLSKYEAFDDIFSKLLPGEFTIIFPCAVFAKTEIDPITLEIFSFKLSNG